MLDYTVLNHKKRLQPDKYCNEQRFDLLTQVIDYVDYPPEDIIMVNEHYVARPDLISLAIYGDDKYADFLCKYNGISNPFELNEGDILYIPPYNSFNKMVKDKIMSSEIVDDINQTIVTSEHKYQVEKDSVRSPAQQVVGESNFYIDKTFGVVFY